MTKTRKFKLRKQKTQRGGMSWIPIVIGSLVAGVGALMYKTRNTMIQEVQE